MRTITECHVFSHYFDGIWRFVLEKYQKRMKRIIIDIMFYLNYKPGVMREETGKQVEAKWFLGFGRGTIYRASTRHG